MKKVKTKSIVKLVILAVICVFIYIVAYTAILNDAIFKNDITRATIMLHLPGNVNRSNIVPMVEYYGSLPLTNACYYGRVEIVEMLIKRGADVDGRVTYSNVNGYSGYSSPIISACISLNPNQYEIVKLLVENGADVNISGDGRRPMAALFDFLPFYPDEDYSDMASRTETFFFLIENGAEIDSKEGILRIVSKNNNDIEIVKYLVENGADVNDVWYQADPPLICATAGNAVDNVEYLLSKGANPNLRNSNQQIAMDIAKANENEEIIALLREYGSGEVGYVPSVKDMG